MKNFIVTAVAVVAAAFVVAGGAEADIKEGEWSMTTVIHMPGMDAEMAEAETAMAEMSEDERAMMEQMMGGMKMGAGAGGMSTTITQCISNANPVPEASNEEDCESTHTVRGNTVNFETVCETSRSTGHVTYSNNNMSGNIQSVTTENGQEENVTIDISGEYLGPCGADAAGGTIESGRGLSLKEKELELKEKELELRERELELQSTANTKKKNPTFNDVNSAVNATNNVRSTFSGLRSLLGR
jgi:hypothetical protein